MKTLVKILAIIVGLMSAALGAAFMFSPELLMEKSQLSANGFFGYSTIRGLVGGPALIAGLLVLGGILLKKYEVLLTSIFIFLGWAIGRLASLFLDGFDQSVLANVFLAFLMMTVIIIAHKSLLKHKI